MYFADGRKFSDAGRYFLGSFVFELSTNGAYYVLKSIDHSQGFFQYTSGSSSPEPVYHVKDYVGSVRVVYRNGQAIARNDYFPFGMKHENWNQPLASLEDNRPRFNSADATEEYWASPLNYDWRMYDPYVGRWLSQDPEYQFQNSYTFTENDAVNFVDPDGRKLYIQGPAAGAAFSSLQSMTNIGLTRNESTGEVTYTSTPLTRQERMLADVIDDSSINVYIEAVLDNYSSFGGGVKRNRPFIAGGFYGNSTGMEGGVMTTTIAKQAVNPQLLSLIEIAHQAAKGTNMLHEVTEAYEGARQARKNGVTSVLPSGLDQASYRAAHNAAYPASKDYKGEDLFYKPIKDGFGNELGRHWYVRVNPVNNTPSYVQFLTTIIY